MRSNCSKDRMGRLDHVRNFESALKGSPVDSSARIKISAGEDSSSSNRGGFL
jgi:hypothetical protein